MEDFKNKICELQFVWRSESQDDVLGYMLNQVHVNILISMVFHLASEMVFQNRIGQQSFWYVLWGP